MDAPYPAHWEADVVLRDGGTAHLRPMRPDDADALVRFHARLSERTIYNRFFAPYPRLSPRDLRRFTQVDHVDRVALVATVGEEIIGVVRYERTGPHEAEVAFTIEDAHQGRGLGSVFLEHVAAAARERGITHFEASVLPTNGAMIEVFAAAGFAVRRALDDGIVTVDVDLAPTALAEQVRRAREHRAEARSVERMLRPSSVVVVGASQERYGLGRTVLDNLVAGGFAGPVAVVHRSADTVGGVPAYPTVGQVPFAVELAVVAVPAPAVHDVVLDCALHGVRALVVVSSGFAEAGEEGRRRQEDLVRTARANGMRVLGPGSFGLLTTEPAVRLNASLAPVVPPEGTLGLFAQSGSLGITLLQMLAGRGLGVSSFVSAGNRADVSGNDLLQFWADDERTSVVVLYLESVGNPRKFTRLARDLGRRKPVVVVRTGGGGQGIPLGHDVRPTQVPAAAVQALFEQAGVLDVDDVHQAFDVAQLLATQPLPAGRRVSILGNSDALGVLAASACAAAGLDVVSGPQPLGFDAAAADYRVAIRAAVADPGVDAVVALFIPPLVTRDEEVADAVSAAAAGSATTVVGSFPGMRATPVTVGGSVPSYPTPEEAVRALAAVTRYAEWRRRPAGAPVDPDGVDLDAAQDLVDGVLAEHPAGRELDEAGAAALLAAVGVRLVPSRPARDPDGAAAGAQALGYPVALKARAPWLRHRSELGGVRLHVDDEPELRAAWQAMVDRLGDTAAAHLVTQPVVPAGVATVVRSREDLLFGPLLAFGIGGVATELLDDVAWRVPPLSGADVAAMVRSVRAAPLLLGHRGAEPADLAALEDVVARVSVLAEAVPAVAELELNPVVVATAGAEVVGAQVLLRPPSARADRGPRALL